MATCAECGSVKLTEKPCPQCGRMNNVGNPKPFADVEKLANLQRGLYASRDADDKDRAPKFVVVKTGQ